MSSCLEYLFQFVHQVRRVLEGLPIAIVQAFGENLVDDPVFAFNCQLLLDTWRGLLYTNKLSLASRSLAGQL